MYQTVSGPPQADVDVGSLLKAVWQNRGWLVTLVLIVGLAAYMAASQMVPMYNSETHLLIENGESAYTRPVSGEPMMREQTSVLVDPEAIASQVQVLLSRDLALHVIRELKLDSVPEFTDGSAIIKSFNVILEMVGLAQSPSKTELEDRVLKAFLKRLEVFQMAKSRVIAVQFSSADARLAAQVANGLSEAYIKWQSVEKVKQNQDASTWLSRQVDELKEKVKASEAAVERYRSQTGQFFGSNNVTLNSQQLSELNSQIILAKAQRTEAEARSQLIAKMLKDKGDVDAASDVLNSALIQRLSEQRVRVQRELSESSATLMASHPRIKELASELASVRQQIRAEAGKVISGLKNEAQIAGAREASLRESLDDIKVLSSNAGESEIKLRALERDAKANRDLLESYLARFRDASARSDELSVPVRASIISRARVSDVPSTPKPSFIAALAAAGTAILAMTLIVTAQLLTAPYSPATAPQVAPAPSQESYRRRNDAVDRFPEARAANANEQPPALAGANAAETIARRLLTASQDQKGYRVLVAPEYESYDATAEAMTLARLVADAGRSVVLVDASSGEINLTQKLGLQGSPGLRELMDGETTFEQVIRRDRESNAQLIASGDRRGASDNNTGAIGARIFGALDEIYDCVLVYAGGAAAHSYVNDHRGRISVAVLVGDASVIAHPEQPSFQKWLIANQFQGEILEFLQVQTGPLSRHTA